MNGYLYANISGRPTQKYSMEVLRFAPDVPGIAASQRTNVLTKKPLSYPSNIISNVNRGMNGKKTNSLVRVTNKGVPNVEPSKSTAMSVLY